MEIDESSLPNVPAESRSATVGEAPSGDWRAGSIEPSVPRTRPMALVTLHWLIVLCVASAASIILARMLVDGRTPRAWLLEAHRNFGLLVLLLFLVAAGLRVHAGSLRGPEATSRSMRCAAAATHLLLYAMLLVQPLLGWALSNAQAKPVHLLGLPLPALVRPNADLVDTLQAWHQDVAWSLLALVSLHVAASLWHHFFLRDRVLREMWPRRRR